MVKDILDSEILDSEILDKINDLYIKIEILGSTPQYLLVNEDQLKFVKYLQVILYI